MHPSGFLSAAALALALLSTAQSIPKNETFYLETRVINGSCAFQDLFVTTQHTGAGQSAAVATRNTTLREPFAITTYPSNSSNTYLQLSPPGLTYPATFGLDPGTPFNASSSPSYLYVAIDLGYQTPGFHLDRAGAVRFAGNASLEFVTFAVCQQARGVAPYFGLSPQLELLWRNATTGPARRGRGRHCPDGGAGMPAIGECADVDLKAVRVV